MSRPWTQEEDDLLRKYYGNWTYGEIGKKLHRTPFEVKYRAQGMGLPWPRIYAANNARDNQYMQKVQEELNG